LFVPASQRNRVAIGDELTITVEGIATSFTGKVRSIASDPGFTPYYALTGDDASRLVYRAEVLLQGEAASRLPAGLPLTAELKQP
jgi:HlyD family secretion protein